MASLDGISLIDIAAAGTSGAAFLLAGTPRTPLRAATPGGWTVESAAGSKYVIARRVSPSSNYEEARSLAFRATQQGLDLWAIARIADLGIRDAEIEHIAWWPESNVQVLRLTTISTISPTLSGRMVVRDGNGIVVPPPEPPAPSWHESLRYFRLSQVADDLFDGYRNLYLALESLLDRVAPQAVNPSTGRPTEPEGSWFRRALGVAASRISLVPFAAPGAADPIQDLYDHLYIRTRTAVFHAKTSRPSILPHSPGSDRAQVAEAFRRAARLFIALAEAELGARSVMSGFFVGGFDLMTQSLKTRLRLHATDDPAAATPESLAGVPAGGNILNLDTRQAPELEQPFQRAFLGSAVGPDLAPFGRVTAVFATVDGHLAACGSIEGNLTVQGIQRLEAHLGLRLRNAQMPKQYFGS